MKLNVLGKLLSTISILLAIWYFDWHNWNQILLSVLLLLSGVIGFLSDTEFKSLLKLKRLLQITALIVAAILVIKTFVFG